MDLSPSIMEVLLLWLFIVAISIVIPCVVYRWLRASKKLPKGLAMANAFSVLPIVAAPFVAYASIWIAWLFPGWEYLILALINSYSIVLIAMVFLSAWIYKKHQSTRRALLPLIPSLIAYCALLVFIISPLIVSIIGPLIVKQ